MSINISNEISFGKISTQMYISIHYNQPHQALVLEYFSKREGTSSGVTFA